MWATLDLGYWLCLLLAVPAAGFLVRLFMIQHDCGHGAFFPRRSANDWVGRVIGVLTLTPYDYWRRKHAIHHATSGNLERRGIGDVDTLTVHEYLARSRWGRLRYRLYRHPLVMFGLGPAYLFILEHRLPVDLMWSGWQPWFSTMATNLVIAVVAATMIWLVGVGSFLLVHLPVMLLAAWSGSGCSTSSTNSNIPCGRTTAPGTCRKWRCTAARTTRCPEFCAGSPPILGSTTSIIFAAGSPAIGCRACCVTIRSSAASAG
jgi:fatty acid desaturase